MAYPAFLVWLAASQPAFPGARAVLNQNQTETTQSDNVSNHFIHETRPSSLVSYLELQAGRLVERQYAQRDAVLVLLAQELLGMIARALDLSILVVR